MTSRPPEYDNLVALGILKVAASNPDSIAQYVRTATELLADAKKSTNSAHGRYLMAYEGLFSLAMAVLEFHGTRPGDGEGHRISALQRFAADMGFTPGQVKTLTDAHNLRNARTYRSPIPPITHAQVEGVVTLLEATCRKVSRFITTPSDGSGAMDTR